MLCTIFTLVQLLELPDFLFNLWGEVQGVIAAIFGNHPVGIESWYIKKKVIEASVNILRS
jgi:hypothetical protein